ncbi:hypothetical protein ACFSKM_15430 [Ancylobacter dichloromethanicus]
MPQGQAGRQIFLDTENVRVVRTNGTRSDVVFVTFEAHQLDHDPDRAGFAEKFLQDNGFPAYHFLANDNFWFQYPEMEQVLAAVRADIAPPARTSSPTASAWAAMPRSASPGCWASRASSPSRRNTASTPGSCPGRRGGTGCSTGRARSCGNT